MTSIHNPRRLFVLSPDSHSLMTVPHLLHSLTGTPVAADLPHNPTNAETTTLAGYTSHPPLQIRTRYYNADVPIWVDEIPLPASPASSSSSDALPPTTEQWKKEFLSAEAQIVRDAVGAVIICLKNLQQPAEEEDKTIRELLRAVGDVKGQAEEERGGDADIPGLLVLMDNNNDDNNTSGDDEDGDRPFSTAWWEDRLFDDGLMGLEVIRWNPTLREEDKRDQLGG